MSNTPFSLSFTSGGLYTREAVFYAQRLSVGASHADIKTEIFEQNLFQVTRPASIKRMYSELSRRMAVFTDAQITLLATGSSDDQRCMLWLAVCKQYPFIAAFAQAIRERAMNYKPDMPVGEYAYLYDQLAANHPVLLTITHSTREKIRSVAYKMAVDAGILTRDKRICLVYCSPACRAVFSHNDDILCFPSRI
jgi:hypothetical protein